MTSIRHAFSLFLPLLAVAVAAGLCVLLFRVTDAFEYSFLKLAGSDIRQRTETVAAEAESYLKSGDLAALRAYAEETRGEGVRVTVMDRKGKINAIV